MLNRILLSFLFVIGGLLICNAQEQLSEMSKVSLLTVGPGGEIYTVYGHNAIRISDPSIKLDKVYNYGTYDFEAPNFMMNFLRGQLRYQVAASSFIAFMREYNYLERDVTESVLDFNSDQRQKMYQLLEENLKPQNKFYMYDFFYDNCATRLRDMFEGVLGDKLIYAEKQEALTLRNMLDKYTYKDQWLTFGQSLIVGANSDKQADIRQQMFIPDYLHQHYKRAHQKTINGTIPVLKEDKLLIHFKDKRPITTFTPVMIFMLILAWELFLLIKNKNGKWIKRYDKFIHILLGISSIVVLGMWFLTDHGATKDNWNILWLNPLFWILVFGNSRTKLYTYTIYALLIFMTIALFDIILPQKFYPGVSILIAAFIMNVARNMRKIKLTGQQTNSTPA